MTDHVLAALDETLATWEPDDNVSRFAEILRRNIEHRTPPKPPTEAERTEQRKARIASAAQQQSREAVAELDAAAKVFLILHPLGEDATMRVLTWVKSRIGDFPPPDRTPGIYSDEVPF